MQLPETLDGNPYGPNLHHPDSQLAEGPNDHTIPHKQEAVRLAIAPHPDDLDRNYMRGEC